MDNGWIKLHRKFIKWGWYQKSEMVHLFLHFLLLANHQGKEWQGREINRGQFVTGLKSLKKDTGISIQTLRTCIRRLISTGEITNESTNKYRIITLINWGDYQGDSKKVTSKSTGKPTNNQQTTNKQLTSNKNVKNVKNDNKYSPTSFEVRMSELLYSLIKERNPNHKRPNFQNWAEHIDKMKRIDKRTESEIEGAIRWSQQDNFWKNNILSTDKLRKQYDKLYLRAKNEKDNGSNGATGSELAEIVARRKNRQDKE
jgi:hypothetical protein